MTARPMDPVRWQQARSLFDALADDAPGEWAARLAARCPDDPELRDDVLRMLRADLDAGANETRMADFAPELLDEVALATEQGQVDAWIGRRLGVWRITRAIGRGGMGTVYLAEREDGEFGQTAAIKMLRSEGDPATVARFLAERQILARLEHPNIARLLDGGSTAESGPWFALEFVDGTAIDRWCDERRLGIDARLRLFLDVCDAVAYAHDHLVVHRDLKPSNILVSESGRVSLLDFGIAKLLETEIGAGTTRTAVRTFTPEYASPEQIRGDPITTAVDIYALGVVLYELLTGRRPYRVGNTSTAAYERAVLEQDVIRPSAGTAAPSPGTPGNASNTDDTAHAQARGLTRKTLRARLRGDLDAIVLRALRKEPDRRYRSVREMARDVGAVLDHRPVAARRGGLRYVAARFVRRNRLAVAMATVAVIMLFSGLVAALTQAHEARRQRDAAERALAFMAGLFENADPGTAQKPDLTVRDLLDRGVDDIRHSLQDDNKARARLLVAMASAYLGVELIERATPLIVEAREIATRIDDPVLFARASIEECRRLNYLGEYERCAQLATRAEQQLTPGDLLQARLRGTLTSARIVGLSAADRHEQLVADARRAISLLHEVPEHLEIRATLTGQLCRSLRALARSDEAESLMRELIARIKQFPAAKPSLLAHSKDNLASILTDLGRSDEALELSLEAMALFEALYGVDNPVNATKMNNLSVSLYGAGRIEESIALMKRVLAINRVRFGGQRTAALGANLGNLGAFTLDAGRADEALVYLDEAILAYEEAGTRNSELGGFLWWRAAALASTGSPGRALADLDHADEILATLHPFDHPRRLRVLSFRILLGVIDRGPASLSPAACEDVDSVASAYHGATSPKAEDLAVVHFLVEACSEGNGDSWHRGDGTNDFLKRVETEDLTGFRKELVRQAAAVLKPELSGRRGSTF